MSNAETKRPLEDILGLSPNNEPMQRRSLEDILGIAKAEDSMAQQPTPQSVQPQSNAPEMTAPEHSYQETIPTSSILGGEQKREGVFAESLDKQMQKEHLSKMSTDPAYRDDYFRGLGYQDAEDYRKRTADKLEETLKGIGNTLPESLVTPRSGIEALRTGADDQFSRLTPQDKATLRNFDKVRNAIKTLRSNNFWSGLGEGFDLKDIATLGFAQVGDNVTALNALNKAHRGEQLNDMEKALVDAWKLGQQVEGEIALLGGRSLASNIGRGVGESLPFVTEMIATGGAAAAATKGISKAIAKKALKEGAEELLKEGSQQVAKKLTKDRIVSGLQKGGLKLAESAVGSAVRVPLSGGVYKNYTGKRLDQFIADDGEIKKYVTPAWKDALKAGFETFAEYQSEDVGNWIGAPINSLGSRFAHSGFGKMLRLDQIADYKGNAGIEWLRDQAKITNLVGETLGEAYGDALINTFEKDKDGWRQMLTKEYWWQLAGVSSILPLATSIPNVLSSGQIDYSRRVAELEKIKTNALTAIKNSDLRTQLTKAAAAPTIAQRSEILKGINWKDTAISKADGFNAVKYINATTAFDISEGEASETERLARFFPVATYLEERAYMGKDGKEATNDIIEIADNKGNAYTVQSGDIDSKDPKTVLKAQDLQGRVWDIPMSDVASIERRSIEDAVSVSYAMMFGTQAKQQSLDKLQSKISDAVAVGVSNEEVKTILENNGVTVYQPGDAVQTVNGESGTIVALDGDHYIVEVTDENGETAVRGYGINDIVQPEMTAADVAMQKAEPTAEVVATTQPAVEPIPTPEQQAIEGVIVEAERVIDEQIDNATNVADGNVYNCILEDDSEVVIRNGNIVLTENGEIDAAKSDSTIVVEYPDGRKQTISPQRIAYIASAENAQQTKENAHEQLRNIVTEQERLSNINIAINNGDPVVTTDGRQGVVSATKDGTLTLTDTEGNTSAITFEDITDVAAPTEEVAEAVPEAVEPEVAPTTEVTAETSVNEPAVSDKAAEIPGVEIPRLKNGEVDYNSIDDAELFSSLLVQDLGSPEDALEAVKTSIDGYSAEYAKLNEETKKEKDITKRVAKTKESAAIARRLEVLNQVQEILSPKPEVAASEPTVSASATPEVAPTPEEVVEPTDPKDTYRNRIAEWVNKLGINVRVLESVEDVDLPSAKAVIEEGQRVVGWYNVATGEVCLYMPNIDSIADVDSTIVHEVVAHKGMAIMLGNDGFNALCDRVWNMMSEEARSTYINYPGVGGDTRKAADEYIAHLAERVDLDANEQTIWQEIVNFFREALSKLGFEVNITDEVLADLIRASYHNLAAQNLQKQGAEVDTTRGDVLYAVKDVLSGEEREKAVADLMKVTGRSRKTVEKYLEAEESLAQIILNEDNVAFLDLQVDESVPSIWNNSDYPQGTVEFSNICRKRLPLTMIYQRLQKEFPNTVFDATTLETIRGVLKNNGIDVACGLCFVEDRRQLLGEIGQEFIDAVRGEHITTNANQIAALEALKDSGDNYVPNLYELLTLDGMKELRRDHPEVAAAFVRYNNARGMQAGRLFQAYSAYHREILDYSAAKVKSINDNGGLRIFSFSDFEAHHLIDLVQVLTDCAAKGIKVQGYTKVPEFARAVKDTKMKLNRSLIAKGSGVVDENYTPKEGEAISPNVINGKRLLLDTVEGIDVNNVDFFDSTSSSSVGNILVGINDEQIRLAMEDPFVDYIIPFHTGIKRETLIQKGIGEWVNYKNDQVEKVVDANGKLKNADKHINIYTDVLSDKTRTERQFVNKYLKICRERGYTPKFPQFLNKNSKGEYIYTKGYYKFLLDFKMFDKKGYILPQEVVVPIFDNDLNKRILEEYVEGERTAAPNEEVYNEVKEALELENVRFRFIGEKGAANLDKAEEATIRLDNLGIARDMESAGKDAKAIKMATGWERGADDKWRYEEVDTITAKTIRGLKGAGAKKIREARSKRISDLDKYAYITNIVGIDRLYDDKKINATSWPDAQKKVWLDIYNIYKDNRDAAIEDYRKARNQAKTLINLGKGEFMLYEVLGENDSLFKAYPQLRNVKLMIKPYKGGKTLGGYNRLNNTIQIVDFRGVFENDKGEGSASTAVHEIQHIIQGIEGFARGGNALMEDPNKARNKASAIERMTENRDKSERELESLYSARNGISDKMKEWYDAHPDAMYEDALKDPVMAKLDEEYSALGYAITTAQDNLTFFAERLASLEDFDTKLGDEGYRKLAGEVEARNVERRRQMTPEERRQTLASETADVAKEDQIVLEDSLVGVSAKHADEASYSDVMFSVKEMDIPYLDAVNRGDMETAQRMVNEAAEMAGYTTDESWKKNHRAPRKDEENANPFNTDIIVPADYWTHPEWYTQIRHNVTDRESYYNLKPAIDKYKRLVAEGKQEEADKVTVTMYRGVDKRANKREASFRNGDWITPSRQYALMSAPYGNARVIEQEVPLQNIWWDGNSINEWGYDDGSEYTYKDTKNNRKLLDAVTYDDAGNIIPLSERFNPRKEDIRYSVKTPTNKKVTFEDFFSNTSATFELLPKSEAPQRDADYVSERWDGFGVSSRYWYGEDERGKYVVRSSDHWSNYSFGERSKEAFEVDPYNKRYTRIASCRWGLDMSATKNADIKDKYLDGGNMYGKAYLDDFTKWEDNVRFSIKSTPAAAVMDQQRAEFEKLTEEYNTLLQNRDNNPNFESALNEWRDRKVKVLQSYLYAFAEDLGIDQYVVIDIFNTRGVREEYSPIVDLWLPGISEEERQKALDTLSNPGSIGIFAPQNGVLIDVSHSDDSELKVYEETLVHEFSHYDDYHKKSDEDLFKLYVENEEFIKKFKDLSPYIERGDSEEVLATELLSAAMGRIYRRGAFTALVNGSITPEEAVDVLKYSKPLMREFLIEKLNRYKDYAEQAAERRRTTEASYVYSNQSGWNDERGVYISDGTGRRSTVEDEEFVEVDIQDLIDRGEEFEILVPENVRFSIKKVEPSVRTLPTAEQMESELKEAGVAPEEIAKRIKEETGWYRNDKGHWSYKISKNPSWSDNIAPIDQLIEEIEYTPKPKTALQLAREQVTRLYNELRNTRANIGDIASKISKEMRGSISPDLVEAMGKRDFDNLIRIIEEAVNKGDLETALRQLGEQLTSLEQAALRKAYNKMMALKLEGTNPRGVSVSRWVDETAREAINTFKDCLEKGKSAAALEVEFREEWQFGENKKARNPWAMWSAMDLLQRHAEWMSLDEDIEQIDAEIQEIRIENSALFREGREASANGDKSKATACYRQIKINKEKVTDLLAERLQKAEARNNAMVYMNRNLDETITMGRSVFAEQKVQREMRRAEIVKMGIVDCIDLKNPTPSQDAERTRMQNFGLALKDFLIAPAYSMNTMLKVISINAPQGEGRLYDHFVRGERGYMAAMANFNAGYNEAMKIYADKAKEIFGKDYEKVISESDKDSNITVKIINGKRIEEMVLPYGTAMYVYMVNKMVDGRVKLSKMGISEEVVDDMVKAMPYEYIQMADWIQEEYLPMLREKYNETHLECFGVPMAKVDNYVPLKILQSKIYKEVDGSGMDTTTLPTAIVGSIVKRTRNTLPIDLHVNAFEVIREHVENMEHWNAYTFVIQDMNALLSNTEFRRMIEHQNPGLFQRLKEAAQIAAGTYRDEPTAVDKGFGALNKLAASSKIAFRVNTAIKQILSYPAFASYAMSGDFFANLLKNLSPTEWKKNFDWAIENVPGFKARWESRTAGNEKLSQATMAEFDKIIKKVNNIGMWPNAFVDALTCANGAKAVYDYRVDFYKERGYEEAEAQRLAKIDAAEAMNATQQSSEGLFISSLQAKRDLFSVAISTFQNSNFAYLRKQVEAIYEFKRDYETEVEYLIKKYTDSGMSEEEAAELAVKNVRKAKVKAAADLAVFTFGLNVLWWFGNNVWKYAFGDDDDREEIEDEVWMAFALSSVRNSTIGSMIESIAGGFGANPSVFFSDLAQTVNEIQYIAENDPKSWNKSAAYITARILVTNGIGVDLTTFANIYQGVAGMIRDGYDVEDLMNILNAPQSQARLLAGKPKDGETLDEYMARMAFVHKRLKSKVDKKDLSRWERDYIAGQQRTLLVENDYSSTDYAEYTKQANAIRQEMGVTRSGKLNEDARFEFKHSDPTEREFTKEVMKVTRKINILQKQLDKMVVFDDSYLQKMLQIQDLRKNLIEKYDKSNK